MNRMNSVARRVALCLSLSLVLTELSGCGFVVIRSTRMLYRDYQQQSTDVTAALARYRSRVLKMAPAEVAEMFGSDAELSHGSQAPLVGREAIEKRFLAEADLRVLEYEITATRTQLIRDGALQSGTYREKRMTAQGEVVTAQGQFEARWSHEPGNPWRIAKLHTTASAATSDG